MRRIGELIRERRSDLALFQEAWTTEDRKALHIHSGLPYFEAFPLPGIIGSGLLTLSNHKPVETKFLPFTLNGSLQKLVADFFSRKGVALVNANIKGLSLSLLNTHLIARYSATNVRQDDEHTLDRKLQLFEIFRMLVEHNQAPAFIIAGDFNMRHFHSEYKFWHELTALDGLNLEAKNPEVCTACEENTFKDESHGQIDYLFWSPNLEPKNIALDFKEPMTLPSGRVTSLSDHFGWTVDLRLRTKPSSKSISKPSAKAHSLKAMQKFRRELQTAARQKSLWDLLFCRRCRIIEAAHILGEYEAAMSDPAEASPLALSLEKYFSHFN